MRIAVAHAASKRRRRAGTDDLAGLVPDAAESVRATTLEIIGIAGTQDAPLAIDGDLQPAADYDPAFLAVVDQRHAAGVGAGP